MPLSPEVWNPTGLSESELEYLIANNYQKYYFHPLSANIQHQRIDTLRILVAGGIPCILWGADAMRFCHDVPVGLYEQFVIVPDAFLDSAAALIRSSTKGYAKSTLPSFYIPAAPYPGNSALPFSKCARFRHPDFQDEDPDGTDVVASHLSLLPQSDFGLDVTSPSLFRSLDEEVLALNPLNAKILVPTYTTFLEALAHIILHPPSGRNSFFASCDLHYPAIQELLKAKSVYYRKLEDQDDDYDDDVVPQEREVDDLLPEERAILGDLKSPARELIETILTKSPSYLAIDRELEKRSMKPSNSGRLPMTGFKQPALEGLHPQHGVELVPRYVGVDFLIIPNLKEHCEAPIFDPPRTPSARLSGFAGTPTLSASCSPLECWIIDPIQLWIEVQLLPPR